MESGNAPAERSQPHAGSSPHGAERRPRPSFKSVARTVLTQVSGLARTRSPFRLGTDVACVTLRAQIHVLAAFTSLRHTFVSEAIKFEDLRFVRRLGSGAWLRRPPFGPSPARLTSRAGAFGEVALFRWQPGATLVTPDGMTLQRHGQLAVKSLLPSVTRDPQAVADFRAEVELLSKLSHSCLVQCYGTGLRPANKKSGGPPTLFVAMEAVTGGDLRSLVMRAMDGAPRLYRNADVVRWAHDIARGLHYLHTRKPMIVHRDLKLENVLLDGAPLLTQSKRPVG